MLLYYTQVETRENATKLVVKTGQRSETALGSEIALLGFGRSGLGGLSLLFGTEYRPVDLATLAIGFL